MRRQFPALSCGASTLTPVLLAAACALALSGCGRGAGDAAPLVPKPQFSAELARTSNGVAHVKADDFRGLGYGLA
ncbi:MAG TPA: hypothetical protein VFG03_20200, partial [Telluria sp.]|nr:hypothetical protein [Telluria sp.]